MNHLQDTKNMVVILIVMGILTAAALTMLFAVPGVLKSNTPNPAGYILIMMPLGVMSVS